MKEFLVLPNPVSTTVLDITSLSKSEKKESVDWLVEVVRLNPDSSPRRSAMVALRDVEAPELRELCLQFIFDEPENQNLWETAVKGLGAVGTEEDLSLLQSLGAEDQAAKFGRQAAIKALTELKRRLRRRPSGSQPKESRGRESSESNEDTEALPPRVFIAYSWESVPHKDWVEHLATELCKDGANARLDQWHLALGDSLTQFMEIEIEEADFVVIVCTPRFRERSNARSGGIGYEQQIVSAAIMNGPTRKFVPVLRSGSSQPGPSCAIPTHLAARIYADFRKDEGFEEELDNLLRHFFGEPKKKAPRIGPPKYPKHPTGSYQVPRPMTRARQSEVRDAKPTEFRAMLADLTKHYGTQEWWIRENKLEQCLEAILSQGTNWQNVGEAIQNLRDHGPVTEGSLAQISDQEIEAAIRPCGRPHQKAVYIRNFLAFIDNQYGGDVARMLDDDVEILRKGLKRVHGIGDFTSDNVILYAANKPKIPVNDRIRKVLYEHAFIDPQDQAYATVQGMLESVVDFTVDEIQEFDALIYKAAREFCHTRPECTKCPLNGHLPDGGARSLVVRPTS